MSTRTSDDLNEVMQFDHVVEVLADGSIIDRDDLYAPECFCGDGGGIDFAGDTRWTALDGYSGQDRYSGPIMHESEYIGGGMEADVRSTPGVYVAVVITDLDDDENPAGWSVLRLDRSRRRRSAPVGRRVARVVAPSRLMIGKPRTDPP